MKLLEVTLTVTQIETLRHLPGTWIVDDYRRLLQTLEVDDLDSYCDTDLEEVAVMALQDLDHRDAVKAILTSLYEGQFSSGQIQNLTEELKEDSAWDEYSDLADHEALYVCLDLLSLAFPEEVLQTF